MTEELLVGAEAPDFTLENDAGGTTTLSALRGKGVILYFYPKDNTAGCTTQAIAFRDNLARFEALGFTVLGVSRDSVKSHCGFRERQGLNFTQGRNGLQPLRRSQGKDDVRPPLLRD